MSTKDRSKLELSNPQFAKQIHHLCELESKFVLLTTKEDLIQCLDNPVNLSLLKNIPLSMQTVSIEQAYKDFRRERVLFNDVPFIPDIDDERRGNAFAITLTVLLERMMRNANCYNSEVLMDSTSVAGLIMQRSCRTSAGADSFFMVQELFCKEGTFLTQRANLKDPPIKIDVFLTEPKALSENDQVCVSPCLCTRIEVRNSFAIFDVNSIDEITGVMEEDPQPWLEIEAVVIDESNLKSLSHWRVLELLISCPSTKRIYHPFPADQVKRHSNKMSSDRIKHQLTEFASWFGPSTLLSAEVESTTKTASEQHSSSSSPSTSYTSLNQKAAALSPPRSKLVAAFLASQKTVFEFPIKPVGREFVKKKSSRKLGLDHEKAGFIEAGAEVEQEVSSTTSHSTRRSQKSFVPHIDFNEAKHHSISHLSGKMSEGDLMTAEGQQHQLDLEVSTNGSSNISLLSSFWNRSNGRISSVSSLNNWADRPYSVTSSATAPSTRPSSSIASSRPSSIVSAIQTGNDHTTSSSSNLNATSHLFKPSHEEGLFEESSCIGHSGQSFVTSKSVPKHPFLRMESAPVQRVFNRPLPEPEAKLNAAAPPQRKEGGGGSSKAAAVEVGWSPPNRFSLRNPNQLVDQSVLVDQIQSVSYNKGTVEFSSGITTGAVEEIQPDRVGDPFDLWLEADSEESLDSRGGGGGTGRTAVPVRKRMGKHLVAKKLDYNEGVVDVRKAFTSCIQIIHSEKEEALSNSFEEKKSLPYSPLTPHHDKNPLLAMAKRDSQG